MIFFSTLFFSMFITLVLIPILKQLAVRINAVDVPNERKVHTMPIPKIGGAGMALGVLIPIWMWAPDGLLVRSILIGAVIVAGEGFFDDIKNLGFKTKFMAQIAAALVVVLYGGVKIKSLGILTPENVLLPDSVSIILTIFVIVGVTNAINLSDGLDGLAGGITLLSFICIGYLAYRCEDMVVVLLASAVVGAIFGFMRFNTYPATVFMGDTGSQLLGFLAVVLSLALTQKNTPLNPLLPLIILGFPVLDTITVMVERIAGGRSPFVADKNHFHHKLMKLGLFHTEAVFAIYILQTALILTALIFRYYSGALLLTLYILFSILTLSGFFFAEKTSWKITRYDLFEKAVKGRLKILKDKQTLIRASFGVVEYGLPLFFLFSCFIPARVPLHLSVISLIMSGAMAAGLLFKRDRIGGILRLSLYLMIPYLAYLGHTEPVDMMAGSMQRLYHLFFVIVVLFTIVTLKFTRRKKGFKANPMDFLVLFIALIVPSLPGVQSQVPQLNLLVVKIIGLLFGYEVLIGELRGRLGWIGLSTTMALGVLSIKGMVL